MFKTAHNSVTSHLGDVIQEGRDKANEKQGIRLEGKSSFAKAFAVVTEESGISAEVREYVLDAANELGDILERTNNLKQAKAAAQLIHEIADQTFTSEFDKKMLGIQLASAVSKVELRSDLAEYTGRSTCPVGSRTSSLALRSLMEHRGVVSALSMLPKPPSLQNYL